MTRTEVHTFRRRDLIGGHVVLDLVNTVNARDQDPADWLDGYAKLLDWAGLSGAFDLGVLRQLRRRAERDPAAASSALRSIKELREAVHGILDAVGQGGTPSDDAVRRLEWSWKAAVAGGRIGMTAGRLDVGLDIETSGLAYLEHDLAIRAVELLESLPQERTRVCAGPRCGWLFIDRSKAGRRRWCDMATCGNAAKGRRHYQRRRAAAASSER
jgi:predicted RNA-binding Zn ribbon-like protein